MKFGKKSAMPSKKSDSETVYNEKYLKNWNKILRGKIHLKFSWCKIPKERSHCICLSVILIDFVLETGKNYYPQVFLEECENIVKKKKVPGYITDNIQISSNDSDDENFDEEDSNEKN